MWIGQASFVLDILIWFSVSTLESLLNGQSVTRENLIMRFNCLANRNRGHFSFDQRGANMANGTQISWGNFLKIRKVLNFRNAKDSIENSETKHTSSHNLYSCDYTTIIFNWAFLVLSQKPLFIRCRKWASVHVRAWASEMERQKCLFAYRKLILFYAPFQDGENDYEGCFPKKLLSAITKPQRWKWRQISAEENGWNKKQKNKETVHNNDLTG